MIVTGRLRLRPWGEADKSSYAERINTPPVMRHMGGVVPRETADAVIDAHMKLMAEEGMCFRAVERLALDELEIGRRFAEAEWGRATR